MRPNPRNSVANRFITHFLSLNSTEAMLAIWPHSGSNQIAYEAFLALNFPNQSAISERGVIFLGNLAYNPAKCPRPLLSTILPGVRHGPVPRQSFQISSGWNWLSGSSGNFGNTGSRRISHFICPRHVKPPNRTDLLLFGVTVPNDPELTE